MTIPVKLNQGKRLGHSLAYISEGENPTAKIEKIQTTTLDLFWGTTSLPKIDFIKCDVEGAEAWVLEGARETLRRFKPILLFEINHAFFRDKFQGSAEFLDKLLKENQYEIFVLKGDRLARSSGFALNGNYFFIPSHKVENIQNQGLIHAA